MIVDDAVQLVRSWVDEATTRRTRKERSEAATLRRLLDHDDGLAFLVGLTDRVSRPADADTAARHLRTLADRFGDATFLPEADRRALSLGAAVSHVTPGMVVSLAKRRLRSQVGDLVGDAEPDALGRHLAAIHDRDMDINLNLLGEEVHGEAEARRRLDATLALMSRPDVDYVSVKASNVLGRLDPWAHERDVARLAEVLARVYDHSSATGAFVNLDMEAFRDLRLTIDACVAALDDRPDLPAGIVLQAYLPDSAGALDELAAWAANRTHNGGAPLKIRLVKGANLSMEKVEADIRGWPQAPVGSKLAADAAYLARIRQLLESPTGLRVGIGSHNLFAVAWAHLLADQLGVADRVDFEMLAGMAPAEARVVAGAVGGLLLYVPVVGRGSFDAAIAYLVRRFEENAAPDHFLRVVDRLGEPAVFSEQEAAFRAAVRHSDDALPPTNRTQDRDAGSRSVPWGTPFFNEPDTDPVAPANAEWVTHVRRLDPGPVSEPMTTHAAGVDDRVATAAKGAVAWADLPDVERARRLYAVADVLAERRDRFIGAMAHEAGKPPGEADPEVSEAVDFTRYYAHRAAELGDVDGARFEPLGVVVVAGPWNFPVAIPTGGVTAALAAGNAVLLKPAPETPRCAELIVEACLDAGIPPEVVGLIRTPDDDVGRHLITHPDVDGVVLTGNVATADLFRSWEPDLRLFGETSGKNSMVITPSADLDLAVADLVTSAFGHAGQKCSAASLAILVRPVDPRLRAALVDATASLAVGDPAVDDVDIGLLIGPPNQTLSRGLTALNEGESWLLEPRRVGDRHWTPGIRDGVDAGSWFARTECFGPVLGLIEVDSLEEAIAVQNASEFGLTGGIHTLDRDEADRWVDVVEVGNAYVNRTTTGAIVRRQSFGGWKRSVVGPGAKTGGPNYVAQFGAWYPTDPPPPGPVPDPAVRAILDAVGDALGDGDLAWLEAAAADDERWWTTHFGVDHDPTGLTYESNVFRYRPLPGVAVRMSTSDDRALARVVVAAVRAGASPVVSTARPTPVAKALGAEVEPAERFTDRLEDLRHGRVRAVGAVEPAVRAAAHAAFVEVVEGRVTPSGCLELRWPLREQAVSRTLHRYGTLTD